LGKCYEIGFAPVLNSAKNGFDENHRLSNIELCAWQLGLIASLIKGLSTQINGPNHVRDSTLCSDSAKTL
jgi:hypothetical protein